MSGAPICVGAIEIQGKYGVFVVQKQISLRAYLENPISQMNRYVLTKFYSLNLVNFSSFLAQGQAIDVN